MTPEEWGRLQNLFDEVMEAPAEQRSGTLRRIESSLEPTLRHELRRLVEHAEPETGFLQPVSGGLAHETSRVSSGDVVANRFELVRLIGHGGMGRVFEALDRTLGERVAIKIIAPEFRFDQQLLQRFQHEALTARRVNHPNVCRIFDLGEHDGVPYMSMELLEGETLASRLQREPLSLAEWESLARQLFDGLGAAHAAHVIHRDLKPSNIILVGSRVVIIDFGLARAPAGPDGSRTTPGTLIGTLDWMAPEQLVGRYDERTDLYSAAFVLLLAFPGTTAENGEKGLVGALSRATGETNYRRQVPDSVPAGWRSVLSSCLDRDPDRRPANVADALARLKFRRRTWENFRESTAPYFRLRFALPLILAVLSLIYGGFRYLGRQGLPPGSVVMFASVHNTTGDTSFDGLKTVLQADLIQSNFFSLWDERGLDRARNSVGVPADAPLTPELWTRLARADGVDLLVSTTLSRNGAGYGLKVELNSLRPDNALNAERVFPAQGEQQLFDAAHQAVSWILGTANSRSLNFAPIPIADITSKNWEALRLFGQAQELNLSGKTIGAIPLFRRATELDPDFAMAHMRLGDLLNQMGDMKAGYPHWQTALDLARRQHLSAREQLSIETRYRMEVRDYEGAVAHAGEWTRRYPNDDSAKQALVSCLFALHQYEEAIDVARTVSSKTTFGQEMIVRSLAMSGRIEEAKQELEKLSLTDPPSAERARPLVTLMEGDGVTTEGLLRKLIENDSAYASRAVMQLAYLQADSGRLDDAMATLDEGIRQDQDHGQAAQAAPRFMAQAEIELLRGQPKKAVALVHNALPLQSGPELILDAVVILARANQAGEARRWMAEYPTFQDPRFEAARLRMQGEILAADGNYTRALEVLQRAHSLDRPLIPKGYLARAQELAGLREDAILTYQQIEKAPWVPWSTFEDWLGERWLARQKLKSLNEE